MHLHHEVPDIYSISKSYFRNIEVQNLNKAFVYVLPNFQGNIIY